MLISVIFINGIYYLVCASIILKVIPPIPVLSKLHRSILRKTYQKNPMLERFFAYWIFTYGCIRLSNHYPLIAASYWIEAAFIYNEYRNRTVEFEKSLFIILSSTFLGGMALGLR